MKFNTVLELEGIPFEIEACFIKGYRQTSYNPEEPDDIELNSISLAGIELTNEQEEFFIRTYGKKDFYTWLMEEAYLYIEAMGINNLT